MNKYQSTRQLMESINEVLLELELRMEYTEDTETLCVLYTSAYMLKLRTMA